MTVPLNFINRFDLVTNENPHAISKILDLFALHELAPIALAARASRDNTYWVSITVKGLGEKAARAICEQLRAHIHVRRVHLEHILH